MVGPQRQSVYVREDTLPSAGNGTMIHQLCSDSLSHYTNIVMQKKVLLKYNSVCYLNSFVKFVYLRKQKKNAPLYYRGLEGLSEMLLHISLNRSQVCPHVLQAVV